MHRPHGSTRFRVFRASKHPPRTSPFRSPCAALRRALRGLCARPPYPAAEQREADNNPYIGNVSRETSPFRGGNRRARVPHPHPQPRKPASLSSLLVRAYIERAVPQGPAMAINGRRNKPFGPGGSTRRLHPCSSLARLPSIAAGSALPTGRAGGLHRRGRNRIDEGVKDVLLPGMVPPLSGQIHSCQRQLCSGCSGRVTRLERPNLKS